jgi:hypothetical protein
MKITWALLKKLPNYKTIWKPFGWLWRLKFQKQISLYPAKPLVPLEDIASLEDMFLEFQPSTIWMTLKDKTEEQSVHTQQVQRPFNGNVYVYWLTMIKSPKDFINYYRMEVNVIHLNWQAEFLSRDEV